MGKKLSTAPVSSGSAGSPLPPTLQHSMEAQFHQDFSDVRVHQDQQATVGARALGASAFTHGSDIYFAAGEYNPGTEAGRQLLAHELTHVVQQRSGNSVDVPKGTSSVETGE